MSQDRRSFLKTGLAAAAGAAACGPTDQAASRATAGARLDPEILGAVASVTLPGELDAPRQEEAVRAFLSWVDAFEPVAELNHGYGTAEIRYGPPDPAPAWQAQLDALQIEAQKRFGTDFVALEQDQRTNLVRSQVRDRGPNMPSPLQADHVGVALLSHWLTSPDATDRCYDRRISPLTCRGITSSSDEPESLT